MSIILASVLAAALHAEPTCSWDKPGVNPFMGDVVASVDHYTDIPVETRTALKVKMLAHKYDDIATITADSIKGKDDYEPTISDMHFGKNTVCHSVSRDKWAPEAKQVGLVYCVGDQCIIVPTICRNVSRVTKREGPTTTGAGGGGGLPSLANLQPTPAPAFVFGTPEVEDPAWIGHTYTSPNWATFPEPWHGDGGWIGCHYKGCGVGPVIPPTVPAVPEPSTWLLILAGLGLIWYIRRK